MVNCSIATKILYLEALRPPNHVVKIDPLYIWYSDHYICAVWMGWKAFKKGKGGDLKFPKTYIMQLCNCSLNTIHFLIRIMLDQKVTNGF